MAILGATLLMMVVAGYGCGSAQDDDSGQRKAESAPQAPKLQLLTARDIADHAEGTPERALLEWWRAMQFSDAAAAARWYAPKADVTVNELQRQLEMVARQFHRQPDIQDTARDGDRATVYFIARGKSQDAEGNIVDTERPLAVTLEQVRGRWLLVNNLLVEQFVRETDG